MNKATRPWVTKADLIDYCRCPFAFSMIQLGLVRIDTPRDDDPHREQSLRSLSPVEPADVRRLFAERGWTQTKPGRKSRHRHLGLGIAGRPDGVDNTAGAAIPIMDLTRPVLSLVEGMAPREVKWTDRWGLAFYWLLLSPRRTQASATPSGHILLANDLGRLTVKTIGLEREIALVETAISQVRQAKHILAPRFCGKCDICRTHNEEANAMAHECKALSLVRGLSLRDEAALRRLGVRSYEELAHAEPIATARRLARSPHVVEAWKAHASALIGGRATLKRKLELDPDNMIVLDTESRPGMGSLPGLLWLIGVRIYREGKAEEHLLWADTKIEERRNLRQLQSLLEENLNLTVATWGGATADIPALTAGFSDRRAKELLTRHHLDLHEFVKTYGVLPTKRLGLKEVASYFNEAAIPPKVTIPSDPPEEIEINNGRTADSVYSFYRGVHRMWFRTGKRLWMVSNREPALAAPLRALRQVVRAFDHRNIDALVEPLERLRVHARWIRREFLGLGRQDLLPLARIVWRLSRTRKTIRLAQARRRVTLAWGSIEEALEGLDRHLIGHLAELVRQLARNREAKDNPLRDALVAYNRGDLEMTSRIARALVDLSSDRQMTDIDSR